MDEEDFKKIVDKINNDLNVLIADYKKTIVNDADFFLHTYILAHISRLHADFLAKQLPKKDVRALELMVDKGVRFNG